MKIRLTPTLSDNSALGEYCVGVCTGEDSDYVTINFYCEGADVDILIDLESAKTLHRHLSAIIDELAELAK